MARVPRDTATLLVDLLERDTGLNFPGLLEKLYMLKYTGHLVLHMAGGVPRAVVLQQETQIQLTPAGEGRVD